MARRSVYHHHRGECRKVLNPTDKIIESACFCIQHGRIPCIPGDRYKVHRVCRKAQADFVKGFQGLLLVLLAAVQVRYVCYPHTSTLLALKKSLTLLIISCREISDALKLFASSSSIASL